MKWVLLGGGGHCRSCISVIENLNQSVLGVLDKDANANTLGYPILGGDEWVEANSSKGDILFLVTLGMIRSTSVRERIYSLLKRKNAEIGTLVAKSAVVSSSAIIGEGCMIMEQALVNSCSSVGVNSIVNSGSIVEHDVCVGAHTHVSTRAVINGGSIIGKRCLIGSGAIVLQNVRIGDDVTLGAGATAVKDIVEPGVWVGTPARRIK